MNINELKTELDKLNCTFFKPLLENADIWDYDDFSDRIIGGLKSADDYLLSDELRDVMAHINAAAKRLDYLSRPIKGEYTIHQNSSGRFECEAKEYTCGSKIEYYTRDDFDEKHKWFLSRVEHNGDQYFIVGSDVTLEGLRVRIRR